MNNLATVLSYLMAEKHIKSAELARRTGIGQPVIYRLMTGITENPQILTLKPIADFFGVTFDQLLGISPLHSQTIAGIPSIIQLNNKLTTIKMISSVLTDLMPVLVDTYKKALSANMIAEEIPSDILPLLPLNCVNLLKTVSQLQEIISSNNNSRDYHE